MECLDYATRPTSEWGKDGTTVLTAAVGYQQGTTICEGNYDVINNAMVWKDPTIGARPIPPSLYYSAAPSYFNSLAWPPFDPTNPGNTSASNVPAGRIRNPRRISIQ